MEKASHEPTKLRLLIGIKQARAIALAALKTFEKNLSNADPTSLKKSERAFRVYINTHMISNRQAYRLKMLRAHHLKLGDVCSICLANGRLTKIKPISKAYALRQLKVAARGLQETDYQRALSGYPDSWIDCPEAWRWSSAFMPFHSTLSTFKALQELHLSKRVKGHIA